MTIDTDICKVHYIGQDQTIIPFDYRVDKLSEVYVLHISVGGIETEGFRDEADRE